MFQVYEKAATNTRLLGTYCGTTSPPLMTSQHIFIVMFRSDIVNAGRGFHATFYKTAEGNELQKRLRPEHVRICILPADKVVCKRRTNSMVVLI